MRKDNSLKIFKPGIIIPLVSIVLAWTIAGGFSGTRLLAAPYASPWLVVRPKRFIRGSVALATFTGPKEIKPEKILWHEVAFPFFKNRKGKYQAFLTVPLSERYKRQFFTLVVSIHGSEQKSGFALMAYRRFYRTIVLRLGKRADISPPLLAKIKHEREALNQILTQVTPAKYWHGRFIKPVPYPVTSPFGTHRKINGSYISIHRGVDFRAPMGTSVRAINAGVVAFSGHLTLTGKTVVINHGKGLYSLYGHLSDIQVVSGERVKKGQVVGLSGMTGRATGPHLHLGVFLCGIPVDPITLMHLHL